MYRLSLTTHLSKDEVFQIKGKLSAIELLPFFRQHVHLHEPVEPLAIARVLKLDLPLLLCPQQTIRGAAMIMHNRSFICRASAQVASTHTMANAKFLSGTYGENHIVIFLVLLLLR